MSIESNDLWAWFQTYKSKLITSVAVLEEDDEFTIGITEEHGFPSLVVSSSVDGEIICSETSFSPSDLIDSFEKAKDLFGFGFEAKEPDTIAVREKELMDGFLDYLRLLLGDEYKSLADETDPEVLSAMEETIDLIANYGFPIYRPTKIGNDIDDYPYTDFEDDEE